MNAWLIGVASVIVALETPATTVELQEQQRAAQPAVINSATVAYALIITNNRSLDLERPDLHYADDDGVQYADLFRSYLGAERVTLLTTFDRDSAGLYPEWVARARPPTLTNLTAAVAALAAELETARQQGKLADVYLVFAGHGDIRFGQGYLELADARLDAPSFEHLLIAPLHDSRTHVILDSCNSYFMLNPRKPGGKRWAVSAPDASGLLQRYPSVGAFISTSAEALTFEWNEIQSGIFSYIVRSGLRGAADVDGDSVITYDELGAFVAVATRPVLNELYRPRIFFAGPNGDGRQTFLTIPATARRLRVPPGGARRLTMRTADGVRLADLHKEDGYAATLVLPEAGSSLHLAEVDATDERPQLRSYLIPPHDDFELGMATSAPSAYDARGHAPFGSIFAQPFGPVAFAEQQAAQSKGADAYFGVTLSEATRLREHLFTAATLEHDARIDRGLLGIAAGAFVAALSPGLAASIDNRRERELFWGAAVGGTGVLLGASLLTLWLPTGVEDVAERYNYLPMSDEEERAASVIVTERAFAEAVNRRSAMTRWTGWLMVGSAVALSGAYLYWDATADRRPREMVGYGTVALALGLGGAGFYLATGFQAPSERVWQLYESVDTVASPDALPAPHPLPSAHTTPRWVVPTVMSLDKSILVGLTGQY